MKPREARVEFRRDAARRRIRGASPSCVIVDEAVSLLGHPWHEPTLEELEGVARTRVARSLPDLRGGWDGLDPYVQVAQIELVRVYVADVVGLTAVRVLEQAAERADAESCPKVAAWLRALSREVEV